MLILSNTGLFPADAVQVPVLPRCPFKSGPDFRRPNITQLYVGEAGVMSVVKEFMQTDSESICESLVKFLQYCTSALQDFQPLAQHFEYTAFS